MISVLFEIEGGLVRNVITDEVGHEIQLTVDDKDKERPIQITQMEAEVRKSIFRKRCEYIIKDCYKQLGANVVVNPDHQGENPQHEFTGTLKDVRENGIEDYLLVVEDQNGESFEVDYEQVEFE